MVFSSLGNWYLFGHDHLSGEERVFRVDRIRTLEISDERFEPPREVPEPQIRYVPSDDDVQCVIDLGPRARWVIDYYPVEILSEDGDAVRVRFSSADPSVPAGLLLRLGADAVLVEGDEVAEALARLREEVLALYQDR